ncbi:MAG TPA: xanthine dehydrogenase family protein molybdopterin-binding subunit [Asanoa sp.]
MTGEAVTRVEAREKVTGRARYAGEYPVDGLVFGWVVSSTVARGRVVDLGVDEALATPGVVGVLHPGNAPTLGDGGDPTLQVLQDDRVAHWGDVVALVVATTPEVAREVAEQMRVRYAQEPHDVTFSADHPRMYVPDHVNPANVTETSNGDVDAALATAEVVVDRTYTTPAEHNNPMEPHASTAVPGDDGRLTIYDSNQGSYRVQQSLTGLFTMDDGALRVLSEHVGGGFGAKGTPRPNVVLAAMAALQLGRPVRVTLTRQQMYYLTGYRTPTAQRIRLGAQPDGRLVAIDHVASSQTSTILEFTEQTALISRSMYATDTLHTNHRVVRLDVPTPRWMRAPGEAPGGFALESAIDELAEACRLDPVELRIRNEPSVEPVSGLPFSSRSLVACLREGARRFGWAERDPRPGLRRDGRWLLGSGVAAATYPARASGTKASATAEADGRYTVRVGAADIGTGARTVLTQIAADTLGVPLSRVRVLIGDSDFGPAQLAGGSAGTSSWSWAVVQACRRLRTRGAAPGLTVTADSSGAVKARRALARHAYGCHFVEVAVDADTGEIRVPRMVGVVAGGRIVNPLTARSQILGAMTMGLSTALFEESPMDPAFGDFVGHDLATYHVAANADVRAVEVVFVDEDDDQLNANGIKGIGEIGIVGVTAAVANAVWHATGVRHRDLPIRPDRVLTGWAASTG